MKKILDSVQKAVSIFTKKVFANPLIFLSFLIIFSVILYYPTNKLNVGISNDEGAFLFMGKKILSGSVPYKDYFDHKSPGIYYAVALTFAIFGVSLQVCRYMIFVINILTGITIYFIGKELKKPVIGQIASILFMIAAMTPMFLGMLVLTEPFVALFCTVSLLCYIQSDDGRKNKIVFLSGVFLGIAAVFKQTAFPLILAFFMFFALGFILKDNRNKKYLKGRVWNGITIAIGMGVVWIPVVLYFFIKGSLGDMIYSVIFSNQEYLGYSSFTLYSVYIIFCRFLTYYIVFIFGLAAMIYIAYEYFINKKYDYHVLLVLIFIFLLPQMLFYQYIQYFLTFVPVLSIFAAEIIIVLWKFFMSKQDNSMDNPVLIKKQKGIVPLTKVILVVFIVFALYTSSAYLMDSYKSPAKDTTSVLRAYIANRTSPDDKIFVFGPAPYYYYSLDRDPPSKYIFLYAWSSTEQVQNEIIHGIEKNHVKYVIVMNDTLENGNATYAQTLYTYILTNYKTDTIIGTDIVYIRVTPFIS